MADIRIKDLATTATTTASDDFMAVDGVTNGTRKLSAATPAFLTSVTTPSLTSPAATALTLGTGTLGAAITVLAASNNVGIGTITPAAKLEVFGTRSDTINTANQIAAIGGGNVFTKFGTLNGTPNYGSWIQVSDNADNSLPLLLNPNGGTVSISSTTAGAANAGALVLQGGISAGNTGSAASYFGGAVSGNRAVSTGVANTNGDISLTINGNSQIGTAARWINQPSSAAYNWQLGTNLNGNWFSFMASTVVDGTTFSTDAMKLTNTGAATFAGAVAIGNTVSSVSPTSPNRTITMVVGGVTLYIAAKTTND